jgi:hypothetical protein
VKDELHAAFDALVAEERESVAASVDGAEALTACCGS